MGVLPGPRPPPLPPSSGLLEEEGEQAGSWVAPRLPVCSLFEFAARGSVGASLTKLGDLGIPSVFSIQYVERRKLVGILYELHTNIPNRRLNFAGFNNVLAHTHTLPRHTPT